MKEDSRQAAFVEEQLHQTLLNITNPFSNSKSLLRGSKSRKKRAEIVPEGIKKIKMDKI